MKKEELIFIQNHMDYVFKNTDLLVQAFTRRSYSEENGGEDNEVLEFVGDKALDFIVVKYLMDSYGFFTDENVLVSDFDEGELTQMKSRLVQKNMLAKRIDYLGFSDFLRMGKGDRENHVETKASVKEDLFEAIIGAVALDSNWDVGILERVIMNMLTPEAELETEECENYIGFVQDWSVGMYGELPLYKVEKYSRLYMHIPQSYVLGDNLGRLNGREAKYMCYLKLPQYDQIFLDVGESEKEARYWAAERAHRFIVKNNLETSIRDEIENPNFEESINQLEILARRGYFSIPTYDFTETYDVDGNPIWTCICSIKEIKKTMQGQSSLKKNAKKEAAFQMLQYVLEEE